MKKLDFSLWMYKDEPCRICGKKIRQRSLRDAVYAGYSEDCKSRAAHLKCWKRNLPKHLWKIQ